MAVEERTLFRENQAGVAVAHERELHRGQRDGDARRSRRTSAPWPLDRPRPQKHARVAPRTCARRQSWRAPPIVRSSPATFRFVVAFGEVLTKAVEATLPARAPCADPSLRGPQRRRLDAAGPYAPNLLGADEAAHLQHLNVLYHRRQRHRQRLGELAHRGRSAAQALDDQHPAGIGQRVKDAIERLMPGALVKHSLKYTGAPPCPVPRGGLMQKVLTDLRFCTTYEN